MGIVVVGTIFVDIKGFPFDEYIPTGRNAGSVEFFHGGVGHNVAKDIASTGMPSTLLTLVDKSGTGQQVIQTLRDHDVNADYIRKEPNGMGIWLAVFDERGDLAGSISKRPEMDPLIETLDEQGDEIFRDAESVVIEFDIGREIAERVFSLAKKYNKKVYALVSNMNIAVRMRDLLKSLDCFVCNGEEAGILFGEDFSLTDRTPELLAEDLASIIKKEGIASMVVTLGEKGSIYASASGDCGFCPTKKVTVRDTTGAGDAFCAGLAIGLTNGRSLRESVKIGTHLATVVITIPESTCPKLPLKDFNL